MTTLRFQPPVARRLAAALALAALLVAPVFGPATAAPGDLDPAFDLVDLDGKVVDAANVGIAGDRLLEQPDGKLVVVGRASFASLVGGVARLHPDGSPDTTFGFGGHVVVDPGTGFAALYNGALQPDGKIVVVGAMNEPNTTGNKDWLIARLDADGSLDSDFGTGGIVHQPIPGCCNEALDVEVLAGGQILVVGGGSGHLVFGRFDADGTLDATFGDDPTYNTSPTAGLVQTAIGAASGARAIALQSDGKIVLAGGMRATSSAESNTMVARYHADGALDTGFGTGGHAVLALAGDDFAHDLAVQADDAIVVVGRSPRSVGYIEAFAARFEAGGAVDTSFSGSPAHDLTGDGDGVWVYDFGTSGSGVQYFEHVVLQDDGQILVLGTVGDCGSCHVVARLDAGGGTAGHLDPSFVDDLSDTPGHGWPSGMVASRVTGADVIFTNGADVRVLASDQILVLGEYGGYYPLARFEADGGTDASFDLAGDDIGPGFGRVNVRFNQASDARALVVDLRGEVYLAGRGAVNGESRMMVQKYACNGSTSGSAGLDRVAASFDIPGGTETAVDLAIQPDGRILMVGSHRPEGSPVDVMVLARFDPSRYPRVLDDTYGTDGWVKTDVVGANDVAAAVAIQPDGKAVVVGSTGGGAAGRIVVARYTTTGALDASFAAGGADGDGIATFDLAGEGAQGSDVAVLSDGKILVAGHGPVGGELDVAVLRLAADGTLDGAFDGDGKAIHDFGGPDETVAAMAVGPDGRIVLVGTISPDMSATVLHARDMLVARLDADGGLDATFDGDGWLRENVLDSDDGSAVAVMPDGRIVATARSLATAPYGGTAAQDFFVYRYRSDGAKDNAFSGDGKAAADFLQFGDAAWAVAVQPDGKVLAGGQSFGPASPENLFAVARFQGDAAAQAKAVDGRIYALHGNLHIPAGENGFSALVAVDAATGQGTPIGPTCVQGLSALAIAPDGTIYAVESGPPTSTASRLYTLDAASGAATLVGTIGLNYLTSLAFAPSGTLYGLVAPIASYTTRAIYAIDTSTGAATLVANLDQNAFALAFAPGGAAYVAYDPAGGGNDRLGTLDLSTGTITDIGSTGIGNVASLSFASDGTLYAGKGNNPSELLTVNPATGAVTAVGPLGTAFDPTGPIEVANLDRDGDGVRDAFDNCVLVANPGQTDSDGDGEGDACDPDDDNDSVADDDDNCPLVANADQSDLDDDGAGDACDSDDDNDGVADDVDNCPTEFNPVQTDTDDDGDGDACDADDDNDGVLDGADNCPTTPNADQGDLDDDLQGDACDADDDGDGVADVADNCPTTPNADQANTDGDLAGNACDDDDDGDGVLDGDDNCPLVANADQADDDQDGIGNACDDDVDGDGVPDAGDNCPLVANADQADLDVDTVGDACDDDVDGDLIVNESDNCPTAFNPGQEDADDDGEGDACDLDDDDDGVLDDVDNCPLAANSDQANHDGDAQGDVCDLDDDNDGVADVDDNCPLASNPDQSDNDNDAQGDVCDVDDDNDGVLDPADNCPWVHNPDQADTNGDGEGDACDADDDGDGVDDDVDNCPLTANPGQADADSDGIGDACDPVNDLDADGDGILDPVDNCPLTANPGQANNDLDAEGDACDPDDDNDGVPDASDNCPLAGNLLQEDTDGDGQGNACDEDDDGDGIADGADNCPLVANALQADHDGDGAGDACDPDDDDDGVADGDDAYPLGSLLGTVVIGSCDSGVPNHVFPSGATMNDLIGQCAIDNAGNQGQFTKCVSHLTNAWKKAGLITGAQKGAIMDCTDG